MNEPGATSSQSLKKKKKTDPKQTSYTFLKNAMDQPRADIIKNVLYSDRLYLLHSRKKIFCTYSLEHSYIFHDHIGASFLFLLQKDFYIDHKYICVFCLFLLQKILVPFTASF